MVFRFGYLCVCMWCISLVGVVNCVLDVYLVVIVLWCMDALYLGLFGCNGELWIMVMVHMFGAFEWCLLCVWRALFYWCVIFMVFGD